MMSSNTEEEFIVMTPKSKTNNSTLLKMERIKSKHIKNNPNYHIAGGDHTGLIINKAPILEDEKKECTSHISLEFKVFLVSASTNIHTQENRKLWFWFKREVPEIKQRKIAQEFFQELVCPAEFPRNYTGFITKIMKLMQNRYVGIKRLEIRMTQVESSVGTIRCPTRPGAVAYTLSGIGENKVAIEETYSDDLDELSEHKILEVIESAYPNPINPENIAKQLARPVDDLTPFIQELRSKRLIKALDNGALTRVTQDEKEIRVVRQMPVIHRAKQPTIAIITAQYCEKLAVDAMIENTETYVRYTTVGESNVYTLGNIGPHRVVSTKLPTVGHSRGALIASGNTTTRLLGTFQKVEHVFLVGVGGGVPNFTDYYSHVRLGDIVISSPTNGNRFIYMFCDELRELDDGGYQFETKSWGPPCLELQSISEELTKQNSTKAPWLAFYQQGLKQLTNEEADFQRPSAGSDKLYMSIGGKDLIEVTHPECPAGGYDDRKDGCPRVHLAPIASGKHLVANDQARLEFASRVGILAFDSEFDAVVESIYGNRKDNYIIIRGISDYKDGSRKREWQPYASLLAASFMKAIICNLDPISDD